VPDSPLLRVESTNVYLSQRNYSPLQSASWWCCAPYDGGRSAVVGRASESTDVPRPTSLFFAESPDLASSHIRRFIDEDLRL
jgi:hypothetical protein